MVSNRVRGRQKKNVVLFMAIDQVVGWLVSALAILGAFAVLALLVHVVLDVSGRYLLNQPIRGTLEYVSFWWMVPISLFGFTVAQRRGEHIDVPLLYERLNQRSQVGVVVLGNLLTIGFLSLLVFYGWEGAMNRMQLGEYVSDVPIWPLRFLVPLALAILAIQLLLETIRVVFRPDTASVGRELPRKASSENHRGASSETAE